MLENEDRINQMEVQIDHEIISTIGRRQPTARDLRFLMAISRTTQNLERAGDEVARMARMVKSIIESGSPRNLPSLRVARGRRSGRRHAAQDAGLVRPAGHDDGGDHHQGGRSIDDEYNGFVRKLITYMMEDPRTISASLDLLFLAKSIERVGDHAKNIAEQIIFIVKGEDVRHTSMDKCRCRLAGMRKLPRVLVVEDEPAIAELIAVNLRHNGFAPTVVFDGAAAQREVDAVLPDVILLDWMLPGESGASLARRWRKHERTKTVPILMLTARSDESDKVQGLDAGADDYITKPFSTQELLARIRAVLRRRAPEIVNDSVQVGELALDAGTYRISFRGQRTQGRTDRIQAAALPHEARGARAHPWYAARQDMG